MISSWLGNPLTGFRSLYRKSGQARWAMTSQILTSGTNFATSVIIIRSLGLDEFGRFSLGFLLLMIVRSFLDGAVLNPIASIAPKLWSTSQPAYRGFALVKVLAFALATSAILTLTAKPLGNLIGSPWLSQLAIALAASSFTANLADFFRRYQFIEGRPAHAFAIDAVRYSVQLLAILLLAYPLHAHFDAVAALYAMALSSGLAAVVGIAVFGRITWRAPLNRIMWPRHWNFVKWMIPGVAMEAVQNAVPQFLGNALLGEAALGLIRAAQQISNILNLPVYALQQILPSMAASRLRSAGYRSMAHFLRNIGYAMGVASLALGATVILASKEIAQLMGITDASRFGTLLGLFMLLNFVFALRFPSTIFVNTVEDPRANFLSSALGATIAVVLGWLLIGRLGEVVVPVIYIILVIATWAFLVTWKRVKHEKYDEEFSVKIESWKS